MKSFEHFVVQYHKQYGHAPSFEELVACACLGLLQVCISPEVS